ncbi:MULTISPECIES: insecticidal delta-endotoxin Cry8Ea1 family protein [Bacillus]|uniref:insecticidal delta-endotoxin Cry8Ea1 family protein n=1 Tax=Bacillus TaxID=1386 RepID=UPI00077275C4|nr:MULTISPECIES: insecticidal delta-endotoxin Cry8Ea1 family protein [Bacillus]KXH80331.1 hypothetical protein AU379_23880 [Bacillus sp. JH7]
MKYKDRTPAKRKYKQALLATVASMTLGVSTLGSMPSAFADENTTNIPQATFASATDEPVFKRESNGAITVLKDKLFNIETLKAVGSLGGDTLKQAWADSKVDGGNFNNTFRTLAMGSAAIIPYGGLVLSPLIGLLWSADTTDEQNRLNKLKQEIFEQTHTQITKHDLEELEQKLKKLYTDLEEFEKTINPNGRKLAAAPSVGDKAAAIRSQAEFIHNDFKNLISESQKPSYKEAELPIFMIAATAHLNFLHFMELHGKDPKINYSHDGLEQMFLKDQKRVREEYVKYANNIAQKDLDRADRFATKGVPELFHTRANADTLGARIMTDSIKKAIQGENENLEIALNKTINNIAFKQAANIKSEWTLDQNGRPFYYRLDGNIQTGWKEISTSFATRYDFLGEKWLKEQGLSYSKYYFSPEKTDKFEKGEMYRDTTQTINGKTYQFSKDGKCLNPDGVQKTGWVQLGDTWYYVSPTDSTKNSSGEVFKQGKVVTGKVEIKGKTYYFKPATGEMATGWTKTGDKCYYFSPEDNTKNYDGTTFNKGEMTTGWMQITRLESSKKITDYYYFSPTDNATNNYQKGKTFAKGQMWTGWMQYTKKDNPANGNDKWYYLNDSTGAMLHDTTTPDGYKVDKKGVQK